MSWCPDTQHLLVLTADMTIMLLPVINILLGGPTQSSQSTPSQQSPMKPQTRRMQIQRADPDVGSDIKQKNFQFKYLFVSKRPPLVRHPI